MTDDQFKGHFAAITRRFNMMDRKIDNPAKLLEETDLRIGTIEIRLGTVERAITRIAAKVGVSGIPAVSSPRDFPANTL